MTTGVPPERFELTLHVDAADIDELGHVNNVVYVRWIQDVAVAHWQAAAAPDDQAALYWIVLRHEIDYRQPAVAGDTVIGRTWVGRARRLAFERHTELLRARDRKLLARARTLWCPVDRVTRKPTDVSDGARARFSVARAGAELRR
jgi:acyl-CoA thioester hydrolase